MTFARYTEQNACKTYDTDHGYLKEMVRENVSFVFISCQFIILFETDQKARSYHNCILFCLLCHHKIVFPIGLGVKESLSRLILPITLFEKFII